MKLNDFIRSIIHTKLKNNCTDEEINELTDDLVNAYTSKENITLVNNKGEIIKANIKNDILYVQIKSKDDYVFYTIDGEYVLLNKFVNVPDILIDGFCLLDKKTVVNISRIKRYDSYMGVIYFDHNWKQQNVPKLQGSPTVVERILPKLVGKQFDIRNEQESLYSPLSKCRLKST